jgi:hypothetical protein
MIFYKLLLVPVLTAQKKVILWLLWEHLPMTSASSQNVRSYLNTIQSDLVNTNKMTVLGKTWKLRLVWEEIKIYLKHLVLVTTTRSELIALQKQEQLPIISQIKVVDQFAKMMDSLGLEAMITNYHNLMLLQLENAENTKVIRIQVQATTVQNVLTIRFLWKQVNIVLSSRLDAKILFLIQM